MLSNLIPTGSLWSLSYHLHLELYSVLFFSTLIYLPYQFHTEDKVKNDNSWWKHQQHIKNCLYVLLNWGDRGTNYIVVHILHALSAFILADSSWKQGGHITHQCSWLDYLYMFTYTNCFASVAGVWQEANMSRRCRTAGARVVKETKKNI